MSTKLVAYKSSLRNYLVVCKSWNAFKREFKGLNMKEKKPEWLFVIIYRYADVICMYSSKIDVEHGT
jgi:hypothetical protein